MSSKSISLDGGPLKVLRSHRDGVKVNLRASSSETDDAILDFLHSLDCPRSLAVWLLYKSGDHDQLLTLDVGVNNYVSADSFWDAYVATEFLSKSRFLTLHHDVTAVAIQKFELFELQCKRTNARFMNLALDPLFQGINVTLLSAVQRKIGHILGKFSPEEFFEDANWGPGVTTLLKGSHVSSVNKFHSENGITRDLYSLIGDLFPVAYPLWDAHLRTLKPCDAMPFQFEIGNSVVTVPKNAKTDRVIAIEPGINLFFQKSLGTMIRRRMRRAGVDLNYQSHNQEFARQGSLSDDIATIDFSSASDSISKLVVRELLPRDWHQVLESARSTVGLQQKKIVHWEKFSSMGNGFTFELESLIFLATAQVVAEHLGAVGPIYIHGDDVIIPSSCVDLFASFSAFLGFTVNLEKTHVNSPFRESCGEHWYLGSSCKPLYLKDRIESVQSVYKLANGVRLLAHRRNFNYGCDRRFRRCWLNLFRRVPKHIRFRTPYGSGDVGFIGSFDEACPSRSRNGIEGYDFLGLASMSVKSQEFDGEGLLLATLWGRSELHLGKNSVTKSRLCLTTNGVEVVSSSKGHGNVYDLRGRSRPHVLVMQTQQWYNLGPWF